MKLAAVSLFIAFFTMGSTGETNGKPHEFSITLQRTACLGDCPDYTVTIRGDGSVLYEGRDHVIEKGVRQASIPRSIVQKLQKHLTKQDFLHWPEEHTACIDFPAVHITAQVDLLQKRLLEGCNRPGKILRLAAEIDRISGDQRWVGKHH